MSTEKDIFASSDGEGNETNPPKLAPITSEVKKVEKSVFDSDDDDDNKAAAAAVTEDKKTASTDNSKSRLAIFDSDDDEDRAAANTKPTKTKESENNQNKLMALMAELSDDEDNDAPQEAKPKPESQKPLSAIFAEDSSDDDAPVEKQPEASNKNKSNKNQELSNIFGSDDDDSDTPATSQRTSSRPERKSSTTTTATVMRKVEKKGGKREKSDRTDEGLNTSDEEEYQEVKVIIEQPIKTVDEKDLEYTQVNMEIGNRHGISSNARSVFARVPNFLRIQRQPFSREDYEAQLEREAFAGATAIIRCMKRGDQLVSNARLIKWDNGAYQLVVANEVFNMRFDPVENW